MSNKFTVKDLSLLLWAQNQLHFEHPPLVVYTLDRAIEDFSDSTSLVVLLMSVSSLRRYEGVGERIQKLLNLLE